MRKIVGGIGVFLMCLAVIGFLSTLIISIPMSLDLKYSLRTFLLINVLLLLMWFGIFSLGRSLRGFAGREKAANDSHSRITPPSGVSMQQSKAPAGTAEAPLQSAVAEKQETIQEISVDEPPFPEEETLALYRNEKAREEASLADGKAVPELLQLNLKNNKLYLQLQTVQLGELFSGSMFRVVRQEAELPASMCAGLDSESLLSWAQRTFPPIKEASWTDSPDLDKLNSFCERIRRPEECGDR